MESEKAVLPTSCHSSYNTSSSSAPDMLSPENLTDNLASHTLVTGTVIPNRIFVGGIDYRVNERDLRHIFSQYGAVVDAKVVIGRYGMSKGYGFVTFENQEDVVKLLNNSDGITFNERTLFIGQAVLKHHRSRQKKNAHMVPFEPANANQVACQPHFTTPNGIPYIYHNGMAYFLRNNTNPSVPLWSPSPQVLLPYSHLSAPPQQPVYHHCQGVLSQCMWNTVQVPAPAGALVYSQQSEYLYQSRDGGLFLSSPPAMEEAPSEFVDQTMPVYPGVMLPHNSAKNQAFYPSQVRLKPRFRRYMYSRDSYYVPEPAEPAAMLYSSQLLM